MADTDFSKHIYHGYLLKGDLPGALDYLRQFPEQEPLYQRLLEIFQREQYVPYEADADLNALLTAYQRYYRDVFYLRIGKEEAAGQLRARLAEILGVADERADLDNIEQNQAAGAFADRGLHFMGGRTGGYYGPYVWRTEEMRTYEVELPDGVQAYTVKLLDGFISRSWLDYLSFGETGTGGWTGQDGIISCVKASYDLESESFQVSLLKHEAQHARDLARDPHMSSGDLEYRAKLVELIYSSQRNLLKRFIQEADGADQRNGHAFASNRILSGFLRKRNIGCPEIGELPIPDIQRIARELYEESQRA